MSALPNNFQTIPVHSDVGNLNQTVFQGYDPSVCPLIGEIRLYLLSQPADPSNQTFTQHKSYLQTLFKAKNLNLPNDFEQSLTLEDMKSIIDEIWMNQLEERYVPKNIQWSAEEIANMTKFMADYYNMYLQGNDTVS
jgi:hypothetical protein